MSDIPELPKEPTELTGHEVLEWIFPPQVVEAVDALIEEVDRKPKRIIKKKDNTE